MKEKENIRKAIINEYQTTYMKTLAGTSHKANALLLLP